MVPDAQEERLPRIQGGTQTKVCVCVCAVYKNSTVICSQQKAYVPDNGKTVTEDSMNLALFYFYKCDFEKWVIVQLKSYNKLCNHLQHTQIQHTLGCIWLWRDSHIYESTEVHNPRRDYCTIIKLQFDE